MDLRALRKSYELGELDETALPGSPSAVFERWMADAIAAGLPEPSAMTVATVDERGRPSTRVVLLKSADTRGLVFYTNYESHKGRQLAANPWAALQFHWVEAERVVRVEGRIEKVDGAESDAYFASRPLDSRIGAWASPQSQVIPSRALLLANAAKVSARHGLNPPRPPHWGGYRLVPQLWEFWQGRKSRLHDRVRYSWSDGVWKKERLAP
ncbi:MAG: pyridoxamine 5'-phosphate oxidase [Propionibacteriaceae bacterium]|jgi:pyridoxamine 5'-phosphate oxidase|nr:pyridoxamine 5'-phosphate oxidase [Propionibacteriaceae bacterium]